MSESKLQAKMLKYAASRGVYTRKVITANKAGTLDMFMCVRGLFVAVEVKKNADLKPSSLQKYNMKAVKDSGGESYCIGDFYTFKTMLDKLLDTATIA